jgi:mannose-6-phosphate isomerase-like protein (cupin superfamily)
MKKNVYATPKVRTIAHNGRGEIETARVLDASDFRSKCDFVDHSVIPPGVTIGTHTHGNNEEVYFILNGSGRMKIDGSDVPVSRGDLILNRPHGTHGITNESDGPIEILFFQMSL